MSGLSHAMSRVDIHNGQQEHKQSSSLDEFPTLNHAVASGRDNGARRGGFGYGRGDGPGYDPSRTRFAAAVKKQPAANPQMQVPKDPATLAARREAMGASAEPLHPNTAIIAPKPSPRLKLHAPTLLPTLATGDSVNKLYMAYRQRCGCLAGSVTFGLYSLLIGLFDSARPETHACLELQTRGDAEMVLLQSASAGKAMT